MREEPEAILCVRCARARRKGLAATAPQGSGLTRRELIGELDRLFEASGAFEICRRCHEQGTGCCPPTCRVIGSRGCDDRNRHGKTLFCATFVCSALLNAISECDADLGRTLKYLKHELGPAEFHLYEMITRVPSGHREPVQPLILPERYPQTRLEPVGPERGRAIKEKLAALTDEVLEIRKRWHELERREPPPNRSCQTDPQ